MEAAIGRLERQVLRQIERLSGHEGLEPAIADRMYDSVFGGRAAEAPLAT